MGQDIRFCTASDGIKLAYAVSGEGAPLVMSATWPHIWITNGTASPGVLGSMPFPADISCCAMTPAVARVRSVIDATTAEVAA